MQNCTYANFLGNQFGSVPTSQRCDRLAIGRGQRDGREPQLNAAEGMAALGICESLLLALTDLKIITEEDARDLLADVVTTHNDAATASLTPERNSRGSGNRGAHPRWQERYALALTQINAPHCFRASASVNEAHMNDSMIEMRSFSRRSLTTSRPARSRTNERRLRSWRGWPRWRRPWC